jgi:FAD/FMN-containing dehydrogenase
VDLAGFAEEVGTSGPVTITGLGTRGGPVDDVRAVSAPSGIDNVQPDEMTVQCGTGTPVAEVDEALAAFGQSVSIPPSGTVGGALAVGRSGIRRLGYGPIRDTLLQARYVNSRGEVVKAGGPTVKNVSGFDLCRLLVGSHGTVGFIGEVIMRTRPRSTYEQWFVSAAEPEELLRKLHRPTSLLWDGQSVWALLEGDRRDVDEQASLCGLEAADPPAELPTGGRWSIPPSELHTLPGSGRFIAEVGVGMVHHEHRAPDRPPDAVATELNRTIKSQFDPDGRLNPGLDVLKIG